MALNIGKFIFILLLVLPALILLTQNDGMGSSVAFANEDETDNEQDNVSDDTYEDEEDDEETTIEDDSVEPNTEEKDAEEKEEDEEGKFSVKASPDAITHLLFTTPTDLKFIAGQTVQFLTGFQNNGESDFTVDYIEASFRYPQDFNYFIQNFTTSNYNSIVKPKKQATFEYAFKPSDTFNSRPFGLTINMKYHNEEGKEFIDAVFNETVQIQEPDDGFDGEAFFLYIIMAAIVALLSLGAHHLFNSYGRKHLPKKARYAVEMGTSKNNVDYDWIPKHAVESRNKSPKNSPKQSPRQKKTD